MWHFSTVFSRVARDLKTAWTLWPPERRREAYDRWTGMSWKYITHSNWLNTLMAILQRKPCPSGITYLFRMKHIESRSVVRNVVRNIRLFFTHSDVPAEEKRSKEEAGVGRAGRVHSPEGQLGGPGGTEQKHYIYTHTHAHTYTYIYKYTYIYTYTYTHTYIYTHTHIYIYTYIYTHTVYIHIHTHTYRYTYTSHTERENYIPVYYSNRLLTFVMTEKQNRTPSSCGSR